MSDGNRERDFRIFETLYYQLLRHYEQALKAKHRGEVIQQIKGKLVKVIDSTTISLCLSLFDWAKLRTAKGGIKIHACWDQAMMIPHLINITPAAMHDSKGIDKRIFAEGTILIEDKGYFYFELMLARIRAKNIFVTSIKDNTVYQSICELELTDNKDQHIIKDELIGLIGTEAVKCGLDKKTFRCVAVYDQEHDRKIEIITNQTHWSTATIAERYKMRWQIELFFKAPKQNLQVKTIIGTSENAVKSHIYVTLICYLLLELIRKNVCKASHAFSNFTERIRICLNYYLSLDYVCNSISQGAKRIYIKPLLLISPQPDLFSG